MNKPHTRTPSRPLFRLAIFAALLTVFALYQTVYAVVVSQTNSTAATVDSQLVSLTVAFAGGDFPDTGVIAHDVDVQVAFDKSSSSDCINTDTQTSPYHEEIFYRLSSPAATGVVLVENQLNWGGTGTGATYPTSSGNIPVVTVNFDDAAADLVGTTNGGVPESGTFRPVQPLAGFMDEDPVGTWTLEMGDDTASDPLCHESFTVSIIPAKEDTQTITGTGIYTFINGTEVTIADDGGCLTGLTIRRVYDPHPQALSTMSNSDYYIVTPQGCSSGFTASLTLPHHETPEAGDKVCRYTESGPTGWDCAASSFDPVENTITRTAITSFSEWTTADNAGPTAVGMNTAAQAGTGIPRQLLPALAAFLALSLAALAWRRQTTS